MQRLGAGIALLTVLGSLAACAASGVTPSPTSANGLAGRTFLSIGVTDGGADRPLAPGTRTRLDFRGADFSASAGCNTMGGQYRLDGGHLIVGQLSTTDMGCPAALGTQDAWLAQLLGAQPTINLDGDDLTMTSGSTVVKLRDRRVAQPDRPLAGPTWTLETIISGDVASSVPNGPTPTILFRADGTLSVFTGCNQGGATWSQASDGLRVTDLVLTRMACAGAGGQLESAVVAVLHAGTIVVTIQADSLTLQAGSNGLGFRAA
ncbi:MAG TPA: META domain-containing protein [Candidatus Dormibacteraeota bacterium]|nr:META domain-containing protein [Candidatus Dormibacteraeota bacterium]